ncbi:ATP-binding cassette domain-containing protein [uncultured Paraglaciecola sp.]|jgi:putative thiamine transport system ATP-binding protein|uniref:ATP-binding cassette domain-containing protein n=1 Tax=uncultured Paraglaciecola sp. TaxID=1765024 RepID=UPI0026342E6A|nr:ATP-binding cassette domain-containing protein [uncultured Paraglaciecola sp.]|tara:strand:- start:2590 stop:3273 length:684 start_codon:yes stop_codon:yes gene_type:complete
MLKLIDCQIDATGWEIKIPDIQLGKGELLVITGPSGIGKSTLLHWLLGNIPRHVNISGKILIDDIDVSQQAIERRHIGLLMQDVYLFPHLSVQDNICFALPKDTHFSSKKQRRIEAMRMLEQINLAHLGERYPQNLSGGERSRVGLVRALANKPKVMLLDEPFAALDPTNREQVGRWAFQQLAQQHIPSIMVTHDKNDIPESAKQLNLADFFLQKDQHQISLDRNNP